MMKQPVETVVVLPVQVAVGIDGLVFHAKMRCLDDTQFLVAPGVRPDPFFEPSDDGQELRVKQRTRLFLAFLQCPEHNRYLGAVRRCIPGLKEHKRSRVQRHSVGVDH